MSAMDLRVSGPATLDADVLVIGSGAGGATVAATAVERGLSVIVLEEGPYIPAAKAPATMAGSLAKLWRHGGLTAAYGAPPVSYAEGRCVGGSTEINSAIFQRAPDALLDEWARHYRIRDFGAAALVPYYDWAAQIVNASVTPGPAGMPTEILARAGQAMGWKVTQLERGQRSCVGTNMCAFGCPTGGKQSMTATLIPKILASGARVLAETRVRRLLLHNRRVTGVEARARGVDGRMHRLTVNAKKVFLCAGAIHTPALLQGAGFRGVAGKRLRLHPTIKCLALFDEPVEAQNERLPLVAVTEFMPALRFGGSVFTPATFGMSIAEDWSCRAPYIGKLRHAAIYYAMVRGQGHGRVFAVPGGAAPIVTYGLDAQDWATLAQGAGQLGQALLRAGAKRVMPSIAGHEGWESPAAAVEFGGQALPHGRTQLMSIHLFGSCPIGDDETLCAADSFGRVHGAENLFLADASVIPEAPGVNPQASVMALARRNALHGLA